MRPIGRVWIYICGDTAFHLPKIVRILSGKLVLIFPYIGSQNGTKNYTEKPLGIPVYTGCATLYARAYKKAS